MFACVALVIVLKVWSSLRATDWWTVLKLYFCMDSITPNIIASSIGIYTVLDVIPNWNYNTYLIAISFPFWVLVKAGSLRVHIRC